MDDNEQAATDRQRGVLRGACRRVRLRSADGTAVMNKANPEGLSGGSS